MTISRVDNDEPAEINLKRSLRDGASRYMNEIARNKAERVISHLNS
jgi:hypothetical protein